MASLAELTADVQHKEYMSFLASLLTYGSSTILPSSEALLHSKTSLHSSLPSQGLGSVAMTRHLLGEVVPGLNLSSLSPNYYGFVTGGATPISRFADFLVTTYDQNVSVHLPSETVASVVEDKALRMLCELFEFQPDKWPVRTLTTGATASNIIGLGAGREYCLRERARQHDKAVDPVQGLLANCLALGVDKIQVLGTSPHSSLGKAAAIVGIGSANLIDVSIAAEGRAGIIFDMAKLENYLKDSKALNIVAVSCSEVNLGAFATSGEDQMRSLRELCDKYRAWVHVDAAFGIFAGLLPSSEPSYELLRAGVAGLHYADSITSDCHKLLNVPYDTGLFLSKHVSIQESLTANPNAPYLKSIADDGIISPLNLGLENSRRFRALPVYATLLAYGKHGYTDMIVRMVELARAIAAFIIKDCPHLEVLIPENSSTTTPPKHSQLDSIFMIVAFRHKDEERNKTLVQRIKDDRRIYVSGTVIGGKPATRIAVAKWDVDVQRDLEVVKKVLIEVA